MLTFIIVFLYISYFHYVIFRKPIVVKPYGNIGRAVNNVNVNRRFLYGKQAIAAWKIDGLHCKKQWFIKVVFTVLFAENRSW